jgi:hypothetical protein
MNKNLKVEKVSNIPPKPYWFAGIANKEVMENSPIIHDLTESLVNKIDLFLSNTDLTKLQQHALIKIFQEVHDEGYSNCVLESE